MNYFLDTEFTRLPWEKGSNLASIGVVREDGKEFFACLNDFEKDGYSEFFEKVNLPLLPNRNQWKAPEKVKSELTEYFDVAPTNIWSIFPNVTWLIELGLSKEKALDVMNKYADYDLQLIKRLFGSDYPAEWPERGADLHPVMDKVKEAFGLPSNDRPHDALFDALRAWEIWKTFKKIEES